MTETRHPTTEQWLDLLDGRLAADDEGRLRQHLEVCVTCRERWEEHRALRASLADAGAGEDAPRVWVRRVQDRAFGTRRAAVPWIAFDSALDALAGMRGGDGAGRQYLIEAGTVDVEISIAAVGPDEPWPVSGQIIPHAGDPVGELAVVLIEGERAVETVSSSPQGEFLFTRRPQGSFRVRVSGETSFETPDLEP